MPKTSLIFLATLSFSFSVCTAGITDGKCENGTLKISLFGTKSETGNWNVFYKLDRKFCKVTNIWRLDLSQNATTLDEETQYLHLKGVFSEGVPQSELNGAVPVYFGHDDGSRDSATAVVSGGEERGKITDPHGTPIEEVIEEEDILYDGATPDPDDFYDLSSTDVDGNSTAMVTLPKFRNNQDREKFKYNATVLTDGTEDAGPKPETGGKIKIISRAEWKARDPKQTFKAIQRPVKFVYVTRSNVKCPPAEGCAPALRQMQTVLIDCFGDVYPNFYVSDEGRSYEGLGWNRARTEDAIYFHFLTDGWMLPSPQTMASFGLLLWEGVRIGRIAEGYEMVENRHLTKGFRKELKKWVGWSKDMWTSQ